MVPAIRRCVFGAAEPSHHCVSLCCRRSFVDVRVMNVTFDAEDAAFNFKGACGDEDCSSCDRHVALAPRRRAAVALVAASFACVSVPLRVCLSADACLRAWVGVCISASVCACTCVFCASVHMGV